MGSSCFRIFPFVYSWLVSTNQWQLKNKNTANLLIIKNSIVRKQLMLTVLDMPYKEETGRSVLQQEVLLKSVKTASLLLIIFEYITALQDVRRHSHTIVKENLICQIWKLYCVHLLHFRWRQNQTRYLIRWLRLSNVPSILHRNSYQTAASGNFNYTKCFITHRPIKFKFYPITSWDRSPFNLRNSKLHY